MKKLMKLLALVLAVVMLLPVNALAAGNESAGDQLVVCGLPWDDGHFADDDIISGRNYGQEGEAGLSLGDEWAVIFFSIGSDGKRTPVIPTAGKGVTIRKLEKDEVRSGAKYGDSYVCVSIDSWAGGEVTYKGASLKLVGQLPDTGFYTAPEATQNGLLRNDQQPCDPSALKDNTVYFVRDVSDDPNQRQVTDVKKNSRGDSNLYDLEKVSDNVWKITLKIPEDGGAWVNLDVAFQEPDGNAYTEERGYGFEYPRGPELWHSWVDWNEEVGLFLPEDHGMGRDLNLCPGNEYNMIFFTCEYDDKGEQTFTPVPFSKLKASKGFSLTSLKDESSDKLADCFVRVTVDDWHVKGTISCGDYTLKVTSELPDIGFYSKPEISTANYIDPWYFSVTQPNETVYIGTNVPEGDDRTLEDLKLRSDFEFSDQFTLERYNDDMYKLTRKSLDIGDTNVELDATWKWSNGHTETWECSAGIWTESALTVLVSDAPFVNFDGTPALYKDVVDKVSTSVSLSAGESKTVYVGQTYYRYDLGTWVVNASAPELYIPSGALKLTPNFAGGSNPGRYTLSCDTAGEYKIGAAQYIEYLVYDENGKEISEDLQAQNIFDYFTWETAEWSLVEWDEETETFTPYESDYKLEVGPFGYNEIAIPVTVKVTGDASSKPAAETTTNFPDVKATAWYAPAVAFANSNGYMTGNANGTFNPDGQVKGSEFAQILYNKDGKPAAADGASFNGVTNQWYAPAILWAAGKGVITDTGATAVDPTASLTRQQIALMLYNYMGKPAGDADLSKFSDADKISDWALDAVKWAVSEGILKGNADGTFNPTGTAKRSETAQILMNFFG